MTLTNYRASPTPLGDCEDYMGTMKTTLRSWEGACDGWMNDQSPGLLWLETPAETECVTSCMQALNVPLSYALPLQGCWGATKMPLFLSEI